MRASLCRQSWLIAYLEEELSGTEERDLEKHLSECRACREQIEHLAADDASWKRAATLLSGKTDDWSGDESLVPQSIASVLEQLAPTDDAGMLGRLGGYEVSGVIGAGGMGIVLKAIDRALDRIVAIKVMAPHLANKGSARARFTREAKAAAAVLHPNVIAIYSVSSESKLPYLVMPYIRGQSLQKRLDDVGALHLKDILRIGAQVAAGLAAAHEQGLVHRDIKPANILLQEGVERVTITDFGLARLIDDGSNSQSGVIAGTPQFMSPEQARGESLDARSDLFSLGSVLYALCTGHSPFRAPSSYGVLHRIAEENPRPIQQINSEIPNWLCRLIERMHAKDRQERWQSALEVGRLLKECLSHVEQPEKHSLPHALQPQSGTTRWPSNRKRYGIAVVCSIATFVVAASWMAMRRGGSDGFDAPMTESTLAHPQSSTSDQDTQWTNDELSKLDVLRTRVMKAHEDSLHPFLIGPHPRTPQR